MKNIVDAYSIDKEQVYVKTIVDAIYTNENENENLKDKLENMVNKIEENSTQLTELANDSYPTIEATGTNAYIGITSKIKSLEKGTKFTLFIGTDATENCSLNLNLFGIKNIKDSNGDIVTNLKKDIPYNVCYNGTDFILQGKGGETTPRSVIGSTKKGVSTSQIITLPFSPSFIICKNYNASNYTFISQNKINFFGNRTNTSNTIMIASENSISPSTTNVIWDGDKLLTITHFTDNPAEYYDYWAFE